MRSGEGIERGWQTPTDVRLVGPFRAANDVGILGPKLNEPYVGIAGCGLTGNFIGRISILRPCCPYL